MNCLDRHLGADGRANKAALVEGELAPNGKPGEERTYTYRQLHREVCRFANVLLRHGISAATVFSCTCRWCPRPL